MDLAAYFERIAYAGPARPDLATLVALHRAHLQAIPYENLDVQLGRPLTPAPGAAVEKIVGRRRGGWCYEMNGVFGVALRENGFKVTRMAGAANRELLGDIVAGNHLVLLVEVEGQPWIADVGFGDGSQDPFPLRTHAMTVGGYKFRLEPLDERWWRFHNHEFGGAKSFDFVVEPADPALLAGRCDWLQYDATSHFVLNLIVQRYRGDTILQLRGRLLRTVTPAGVESRLIGSADELVEVLASDFALDVPEAAGLWPRVVARHDEVMAAAAAAAPA
ncbi:MAG: arylamine N-acetyltransferase [Caulobacterales bacterium]